MGISVRYSPRARREEMELIAIALKKFGRRKARDLFDRIDRALIQLSEMPGVGQSSRSQDGLRKYDFSKQVSIYYQVDEPYLEIISFRLRKRKEESV